MSEKRILLLHISRVSGHRSAACAVERAIKILEPQAKVLNIDAFKYTNPISTRIVNYIYLNVIQRIPFLWRYLYDNQKFIKSTEKIKSAIHNFNAPKLKAIIDQFRPQVIACTQAYPCGIIADLKRIYNIDIPLLAILTDYIPHSYWIYPEVNFYIIPCADLEKKLLEKGVLAQRIKPLGIPVDPKFNKIFQRQELKEKLGLDTDRPVVLIMGGSHGLGPLKKIVRFLDKAQTDFQELVVTGINKRLFRYLRKKSPFYKKHMRVFGYVENIEELMAVSDMLITKPGGVSISEALAMGLPILIVRPIPGQEESNTVYLIKHGAAIRVKREEEVTQIVEDLLNNPQLLTQLSSAARVMGRPSSGMDIATFILNLCQD